MKYYATLFTGMCCLLLSINSFAQSGIKKTSQFNNFPKISYCNSSAINNLFLSAVGQTANLKFDENLMLEGTIINKISKFNNSLQTLVIQIPAYNNSIFSISKRKEQDNSEVFIGHLYNTSFADGFELKQGKNNQYELVKIATEQVLQPCNQ